MKRLAVIFAVLLAIILTACQNPTPTPTPGADVHADTHSHGCAADADRHSLHRRRHPQSAQGPLPTMPS